MQKIIIKAQANNIIPITVRIISITFRNFNIIF